MEDENKENVDTQTATEKEENQSTQKTETKNEGEKEKKTNATKNSNGSITFGSQKELDGFIDRVFAKMKENQANNVVEENKTTQTTQETQETQETQNVSTDFTSEIALTMAESGIDATKTRRLARLVDQSKCVVNGVLDADKLKAEIEAISSEFPEFKKKEETTDSKEDKKEGFKFGAVGQDESQSQSTGAVPKKRWNRFN